MALPGESYKLAFTPGLLDQVFVRNGQPLLAIPADVLAVDMPGNIAADRGGFVDLDDNGYWWIPAGRVFLSPSTNDTATQELHFFLPHRYRGLFHTDAVRTESFVAYDAYNLLMVETQDALGNRVTVGERLSNGDLDPSKPGNDYRVLQPRLVMDPNRNRTEVAFDALGLVAGTAIKGKPEDNPQQGDFLDASFMADLSDADIDAFYNAIDPHVPAENHLKTATTRIVYDMDRFYKTRQAFPQEPEKWEPVFAATLARETHVSDQGTGEKTKIQLSFSYSDGFGREIQKKIQAEDGPLATGGPIVSLRWVGSGWTVFNNKGKPVRQYEPFFSQLPEKRHQFEFGVQVGVSPILFYDPVERVVATLHPNHTWEKVVFNPWQQATWDVNDTVTLDPENDEDVKGFFLKPNGTPRLATADYLPTWHKLRTDPANAAEANRRWPDPKIRNAEKDAAEKAALHEKTPTIAYLDTLGRPFLTVADNGLDSNGNEQKYKTHINLDVEGNQREVRDTIVQNGDAMGRVVMRYDYDMLGNRIHQASMEAGERWTLNDVTGKPIRAWDSRGHAFHTTYDLLRRPLRSLVTGADPANPNQEFLVERLVYGEQHPDDLLRNLRGMLYLHLDQAGVVINEAHDFKGNLLHVSRRLAREYKQAVGWSAVDAALPANASAKLDPGALEAVLAPLLDADTYSSHTTYDALNRPLMLVTPHNSAVRPNVIQPTYNEANLLEKVDVWLRRATAPGQPLSPATADLHAVTNIDYDAKGQRERIAYGNGAKTEYSYDPETFRLMHLKTTRPARRNGIATQLFKQPHTVQDLRYAYDPAGNITQIADDALPTIFHNNETIEPVCQFKYDAIYRLIEAQGREHIDQSAILQSLLNGNYRDYPFVGASQLNNPQAVRNYSEQYVYDPVGNFERMIHLAANGNWTRAYAYNEDSLIETAKKSNRLSSTTLQPRSPHPQPENYTHDAHGNMTSMPHLQVMKWDYRDQLQATAQQVVNNGGTPETTYYVYHAGGQRVRKVTERAVTAADAAAGKKPTRMKERIYLGGFEVYREYENDGNTLELERESLHVMDDQQRIALVETKTRDASVPANTLPETLTRYQFGNHLGSASLELDHQGKVLSYEEYSPYGSTTFEAGRSATEVSLKRYRYTGKERDGESGFYYHGARYYAGWLCRWISCDPRGLVDGLCVYEYCCGNPIVLHDPAGTQGVSPLPGIIGNDPAVGKLWEKAVVETLGPRLKANNYNDVVNAFKSELARRVADKGLGSNKQAGTGINYARKSYSAVRTRFGKLAEKAGISLKGLQVHHTFDELAKNPAKALETTNLSFQGGNAGTKGSGHNFAHEVSDAQAAGVKNPGQHVAEKMRANGIEPDVPELATTKHSPALPDKGPPVDLETGKVIKVGEEAAEKAGKGAKALRVLGKAGRHFAAAVPLLGIVAGQASAATAASQGDYAGAALDEAGFIPVAGDLLDAGRGGYALGEAANEFLVNEDLAMKHGDAAKAAVQKLGAGETVSDVIGGLAAAGSAVGQVLVKGSPIGFLFW